MVTCPCRRGATSPASQIVENTKNKKTPIRVSLSKHCGGDKRAGHLLYFARVSHAHFGLALSVATLAFSHDRESLGLSFLMFHCLLRPAEARAIEWIDIHIFDDI